MSKMAVRQRYLYFQVPIRKENHRLSMMQSVLSLFWTVPAELNAKVKMHSGSAIENPQVVCCILRLCVTGQSRLRECNPFHRFIAG
jgi:hypothetical protein